MPEPVTVIAITSGKGGVGKTNVSVNLAAALSSIGKSVLLMDADLGFGNVDVFINCAATPIPPIKITELLWSDM